MDFIYFEIQHNKILRYKAYSRFRFFGLPIKILHHFQDRDPLNEIFKYLHPPSYHKGF